jgi:hypothetical protein
MSEPTDVSEELVASIYFFALWFGLLVTATFPSSQILSTLKIGLTRSSETSFLTRPTRCHIPEKAFVKESFVCMLNRTRREQFKLRKCKIDRVLN